MTVYIYRVCVHYAAHAYGGFLAFPLRRNLDYLSEPMRASDRVQTVIAPIVGEQSYVRPIAVVQQWGIPFERACKSRVSVVKSCVPSVKCLPFQLLYHFTIGLVFVNAFFVNVLREWLESLFAHPSLDRSSAPAGIDKSDRNAGPFI